MELWFNHASPFARKCRIVLLEKNLSGVVRLRDVGALHPAEAHPALASASPLGRIPVLLLDHGLPVQDSRVIVDYLDHLDAPRFHPHDTMSRIRTLSLQALADGLMEASLLHRYQSLAATPWTAWTGRLQDRMRVALASLEEQCAMFGSGAEICIGQVATIAALGYLDFRFPELDWRADAPELAAWFVQMNHRESVTATLPR